MFIQEAIKSGKPFRRKDQKLYSLCVTGTGMIGDADENEDNDFALFSANDILADDWETIEKQRGIDETEIKQTRT